MIKNAQQTIDFEQIDISKAKLTISQKNRGNHHKNPQGIAHLHPLQKKTMMTKDTGSETSFSHSICRQYAEKYCLGVSI